MPTEGLHIKYLGYGYMNLREYLKIDSSTKMISKYLEITLRMP